MIRPVSKIGWAVSDNGLIECLRVSQQVYADQFVPASWIKCPYMQKTCDVMEKAILAKKIAEKVRKSRQNVNRDKSA